MADVHEQAPTTSTTQAQPREEDQSEAAQRAAYEAELNRITSSEMIIQTAVSLINIGGRRLGLSPSAATGDSAAAGAGERDLEQVRDAIDGASALLPILERRMPGELGPLRDAIAQLQVAYAREAQGSTGATTSTAATSRGTRPEPAKPTDPAEPADSAKPTEKAEKPVEGDERSGPGPAQASGRLWVPGR